MRFRQCRQLTARGMVDTTVASALRQYHPARPARSPPTPAALRPGFDPADRSQTLHTGHLGRCEPWITVHVASSRPGCRDAVTMRHHQHTSRDAPAKQRRDTQWHRSLGLPNRRFPLKASLREDIATGRGNRAGPSRPAPSRSVTIPFESLTTGRIEHRILTVSSSRRGSIEHSTEPPALPDLGGMGTSGPSHNRRGRATIVWNRTEDDCAQ